jgi:Ca-activated chloride channel homolog
MIRFEKTEYLYFLAVLLLGWLLFMSVNRWRKKAIQSFAEVSLIHQYLPEWSTAKNVFRFLLWSTAITLLIFAIANPQYGTKLEEVKSEGRDIMIALDISNSMKAQDVLPNRLDAAKQAISRLIGSLRTDRIGIVVFAGQSFVQLPITSDYSSARMFLEAINTDMVSVQGTAIGDAMEKCMESFDYNSAAGKTIILITDGENHEDDAIVMTQQAASKGIMVNAVGIGTEKGAPLPYLVNGKIAGYRKDRDGNTIISRLDAQLLREIAEKGNGVFVQSTSTNVGLDQVMQAINALETAEVGSQKFSEFESRFQPLLGLAILLLIIEMFVSTRKSNWWNKVLNAGIKPENKTET